MMDQASRCCPPQQRRGEGGAPPFFGRFETDRKSVV